MPVSKKRKITRVREIRKVTFTVPEVFGDAEFNVPSLDMVQGKYADMVADETKSRLALRQFMEDNGAEAEAEAFDELAGEDEHKLFLEAWQAASGITAPKSRG